MSIVICNECEKVIDLDFNCEGGYDENTLKYYCIDCIDDAGMAISDEGTIVKGGE